MTTHPPRRIQRRRTRGWRMPEGAVSVTRPGRWGNPYGVGDSHPDHLLSITPFEAVELYRQHLRSVPSRIAGARAELEGKDLACWCRLCPAHADGLPLGVECADCAPCHAEVLLEVANGAEP